MTSPTDCGPSSPNADSPARWRRALLLLHQGDYSDWPRYEWGLGWYKRRLPLPLWHGQPLQGRSVFVYCDEGYGDFIQFYRYVPYITGGRVVLECPPDLSPLFQADEVIPPGAPTPPCDFHCPVMLLPRCFGIENGRIPNRPYLSAPPGNKLAELTDAWDARRIGVVWKGNPKHRDDHNRSLDPRLFSTLPGTLFGLQKGVYQDGMVNLGAVITDWADTAALVAKMHLVISVDTAVAHLAGALGTPTWLLLPSAPDWRWQRGSDWYPSARLFRRKTTWEEVFERVRKELA